MRKHEIFCRGRSSLYDKSRGRKRNTRRCRTHGSIYWKLVAKLGKHRFPHNYFLESVAKICKDGLGSKNWTTAVSSIVRLYNRGKRKDKWLKERTSGGINS